MHRRKVFEPPEPKVDYPYYVFGTLGIIILVKGTETKQLRDPWRSIWGALFETFLLPGGPRTLKLMAF